MDVQAESVRRRRSTPRWTPTVGAERTFGIHRPITIEAWLYLNGEYQTLVEGQAIIQGARSAQESLGEARDGRGEVAIFRTTAYRSIDTGQHQR